LRESFSIEYTGLNSIHITQKENNTSIIREYHISSKTKALIAKFISKVMRMQEVSKDGLYA